MLSGSINYHVVICGVVCCTYGFPFNINFNVFLFFKLKELAKDRLMVELAREQAMVIGASRDAQAKASSLTAAAVGASLGAGLGIVLAVVMGAASALRKP